MSEEIVKVDQLSVPQQAVEVLQAFNNALLGIDDYRQELAENGDWESLSFGLSNLVELRNQLTVLMQSIEKNIYDLMPGKKTVIEGVGIVEKRRSNTKKWDSEALLHDIVKQKLDNGTGEITPTDVFELIETLRQVLPLTASLGWRVNALKEKGFDPEEYCDITWGRQTISIQK